MSHLLPEAILALPRLGTVNLHPSLLPAYRGPGALFWQLVDGVAGERGHRPSARQGRGYRAGPGAEAISAAVGHELP